MIQQPYKLVKQAETLIKYLDAEHEFRMNLKKGM